MESERKGRKDGESERGVVCDWKKKEREEKREGIFFTVELQRRGDSHAPTASKSTPL